MKSFREFINYRPPADWVQTAIEPVANLVGNNLASGYNTAAQRSGDEFSGGHADYRNLDNMEERGFSPRLTKEDRRRLSAADAKDLQPLGFGPYVLVKVTVPASKDAYRVANNLIMQNASVLHMVRNQEIDPNETAFFKLPQQGEDKHGNPTVTVVKKFARG